MKGKGPRDLQLLRQATQQRIRQLEKEKEQCRQAGLKCEIERRVAANQRVAEQRAERQQRAEQRRAMELEIQRRIRQNTNKAGS